MLISVAILLVSSISPPMLNCKGQCQGTAGGPYLTEALEQW